MNPEDEEKLDIMETGANAYIFIRIKTKDDPNIIAKKMMQDFITNSPRTRYLYKIFPTLKTCYANLKNISTGVKSLIDEHFANCLPKVQFKKYQIVNLNSNNI